MARWRALAIAIVAFWTAVIVAGRRATPTRNPLVLHTEKDLPSMLKMALVLLFGTKSSSAPKAVTAAPLRVTVNAHPVQHLRTVFSRLCGTGDSATLFVLPHCLAQKAFLTLLSHNEFPVRLLGAVHLRSQFTIHDAVKLRHHLIESASSLTVS